MTDAVQFGDGFGLAGAVIVHLLGQRQQFELLDFSYHVLNVNNFERWVKFLVAFKVEIMLMPAVTVHAYVSVTRMVSSARYCNCSNPDAVMRR